MRNFSLRLIINKYTTFLTIAYQLALSPFFFFLFPIDIFFWNLTDWTLPQNQLNTLFYRMSRTTPHAQSHKKKPWWKLIYIRLDRLTWAGSEKAFGPCTHRALRERGLKLWTSADRNQMWEWVGLLKDYF